MKDKINTFGIVGIAFGVFAIFFISVCFECILKWYGLVFPIGAIIFGSIGIWKDDNPKIAIVGLILGIIFFVVNLLIGIYSML